MRRCETGTGEENPWHSCVVSGGVVLTIILGLSMLVPIHRLLRADSGSSPVAPVGTPCQIRVPFGLEDSGGYIPRDNPITVEKGELGKLIFRSPIVGRQYGFLRELPHPAIGRTDGQQVLIGIHRQLATRNGMTIINRLYSTAQLWYGRSPKCLLSHVVETVRQRLCADRRVRYRSLKVNSLGRKGDPGLAGPALLSCL